MGAILDILGLSTQVTYIYIMVVNWENIPEVGRLGDNFLNFQWLQRLWKHDSLKNYYNYHG